MSINFDIEGQIEDVSRTIKSYCDLEDAFHVDLRKLNYEQLKQILTRLKVVESIMLSVFTDLD